MQPWMMPQMLQALYTVGTGGGTSWKKGATGSTGAKGQTQRQGQPEWGHLAPGQDMQCVPSNHNWIIVNSNAQDTLAQTTRPGGAPGSTKPAKVVGW